MPRASLPSYLKRLTTYDVLLTQTTEEELLTHFENESKTFEERWKPFADALSCAIEKLYDNNPYIGHNWRRGPPDRLYNKGIGWFELNDETFEKYSRLSSLRNDMAICEKEFKWSQKHDWVSGFLYLLEQARKREIEETQDLQARDELCFQKARRDWTERDAEWIAKETERKNHKHHYPKEYYEELFRKDKDAVKFYKGVIPNHEETCRLCVEDREKREARQKQEEAEEMERRQKEAEEREQARLEEERREMLRKERERQAEQQWCVKPAKRCDFCDYETKSETHWIYHCASKDHIYKEKQASLYCKVCDIQCSHRLQYDTHIASNKHKKLAGEIKEPSLHCEACNYTATTKQNLEIHCRSKKHQRNVETQVVEVPEHRD